MNRGRLRNYCDLPQYKYYRIMAVADVRVKISARNWANLQGKISSLVNHLISLRAVTWNTALSVGII